MSTGEKAVPIKTLRQPLTRVGRVRGPQSGIYVGRPSPFGNPYVIGPDGDRAEVIRLYRAYFYARLKIDERFREKVEALRGHLLLCHCHPADCHADVIAEYLNGA